VKVVDERSIGEVGRWKNVVGGECQECKSNKTVHNFRREWTLDVRILGVNHELEMVVEFA
jgi:hypothetical protein